MWALIPFRAALFVGGMIYMAVYFLATYVQAATLQVSAHKSSQITQR